MAFLNTMFNTIKTSAQAVQPQVIERLSDSPDCLIAHLMLECSEVLVGIKPAILILWLIVSPFVAEVLINCGSVVLASGNHTALEF